MLIRASCSISLKFVKMLNDISTNLLFGTSFDISCHQSNKKALISMSKCLIEYSRIAVHNHRLQAFFESFVSKHNKCFFN